MRIPVASLKAKALETQIRQLEATHAEAKCSTITQVVGISRGAGSQLRLEFLDNQPDLIEWLTDRMKTNRWTKTPFGQEDDNSYLLLLDLEDAPPYPFLYIIRTSEDTQPAEL